MLYYNMGPPSYIRSVVDRNVVTRPIPVQWYTIRRLSGNVRITAVTCIET